MLTEPSSIRTFAYSRAGAYSKLPDVAEGDERSPFHRRCCQLRALMATKRPRYVCTSQTVRAPRPTTHPTLSSFSCTGIAHARHKPATWLITPCHATRIQNTRLGHAVAAYVVVLCQLCAQATPPCQQFSTTQHLSTVLQKRNRKATNVRLVGSALPSATTVSVRSSTRDIAARDNAGAAEARGSVGSWPHQKPNTTRVAVQPQQCSSPVRHVRALYAVCDIQQPLKGRDSMRSKR